MSTTPHPELEEYLWEHSLTLAQRAGDSPPSPPVVWLLSFPTGRCLSSLHGRWSEYAELREVDGMPSVPVIPIWAEQLDLFYAGQHATLRPPEPVTFFSWCRMASSCSPVRRSDEGKEEGGVFSSPPPTPTSRWLYSVFGYVLPQYRFTLLMSETQVRTDLCHRHDLFTLP